MVVFVLSLFGIIQSQAQVGSKVGIKDANAVLDLSGTTKLGFLLPRLELTNTNNSEPLAKPLY